MAYQTCQIDRKWQVYFVNQIISKPDEKMLKFFWQQTLLTRKFFKIFLIFGVYVVSSLRRLMASSNYTKSYMTITPTDIYQLKVNNRNPVSKYCEEGCSFFQKYYFFPFIEYVFANF